MCGDTYPIISALTFPGLITALSSINSKILIQKIKKILERKPNFFQFILKIVPIDFVCETNVKVITQLIREHFKSFINNKDTFKIVLKRRKHEKIERTIFIEKIAKYIDNNVDLENPDKIIRIEILGNFSGISFLKWDDVVRIQN